MTAAAAPALLHALRDLLRGRGVDRLPTEDVVTALGERLGGPITATRLARTLKPYGVAPRQYRVPGSGRRVWGYCLHDLPADPAESRDTAPPGESRDTAPPGESRDTPKGRAPPPLPAAQPPRDLEAEWVMWLAMTAAYRR